MSLLNLIKLANEFQYALASQGQPITIDVIKNFFIKDYNNISKSTKNEIDSIISNESYLNLIIEALISIKNKSDIELVFNNPKYNSVISALNLILETSDPTEEEKNFQKTYLPQIFKSRQIEDSSSKKEQSQFSSKEYVNSLKNLYNFFAQNAEYVHDLQVLNALRIEMEKIEKRSQFEWKFINPITRKALGILAELWDKYKNKQHENYIDSLWKKIHYTSGGFVPQLPWML